MQTGIDELIKELDDNHKRYLTSKSQIYACIAYHCPKFCDYLCNLPRFKTTRKFDVLWSFTEDLFKELRQHHSYKTERYGRIVIKKPSLYPKLREWLEKYGK